MQISDNSLARTNKGFEVEIRRQRACLYLEAERWYVEKKGYRMSGND